MGIFNPWKEVRELKAKLAEAEKTYVKLTKQIEKLEFTNKENSREITLLEKELKETKAALVAFNDCSSSLISASFSVLVNSSFAICLAIFK